MDSNFPDNDNELNEILRESEENYRLITENMRDVIWKLSPDFRFIYVSDSDKFIRGYETDEVLGVSVFDIMTPESANSVRQIALDRLAKTKNGSKIDSISYEAELYCKDGSTVWAEIVSNPIYKPDGSLAYFQGISRNITERKLIEAKLREHQEMYKIAVSNAPVVLFQLDSKGIFELSEGKGLEKLGLKPGEVVGLSVFDVYKDYPEICQQTNDALAGKLVQAKIEVNDIIFEIIYNPLINKKGKVTNLVGIAIDVTENFEAVEALKVSENRFRTLFESLAEGVALHEVVFDVNNVAINYRLVEVNQAFERHTGINNNQSKGRLATDVYNTVDPPYFDEFIKVALTGVPYYFETYFPPLERSFRISVVSPGKNKFVTVFEDISEMKKREKELKEKNDELEKFTYTVSHDLKSPLVTIKGFIGMLEQDIKEQDTVNILDDIERIKQAADKMGDLLNDLLELSRIGRVIKQPVKVPMIHIVNETIEFLSGIITQSEAKITIVCKDMPVVEVDHQRFSEVWQNLIENAIKFASNNTIPEIEIGCYKNLSENIFYIKDNGIGVEPAYHDTIFGLFNKLENNSKGTGIGLALVKRIIEVHSGKVWIESNGKNSGSTIKFTLPEVKNHNK